METRLPHGSIVERKIYPVTIGIKARLRSWHGDETVLWIDRMTDLLKLSLE